MFMDDLPANWTYMKADDPIIGMVWFLGSSSLPGEECEGEPRLLMQLAPDDPTPKTLDEIEEAVRRTESEEPLEDDETLA